MRAHELRREGYEKGYAEAEAKALREDDYIRIYHEHYAFMHPGASETVRRADADDFMRRVRALRALRGEGEK